MFLQAVRQLQAASIIAAIVKSLLAGHAGDTDIGVSAAEAGVMTAVPMAGKLHASTSVGDVAEAVARTASRSSQKSDHTNTNDAADMTLAVDGQVKAPSAASGSALHMTAVNQSQAVKTHGNGVSVTLAAVQNLTVESRMLLRL